MVLRWQFVGDVAALVARQDRPEPAAVRRADGISRDSCRASRCSSAGPSCPAVRLPVVDRRSRYLCVAMVVSLVMATTFQLAHCVEEASFARPDELGADPSWAVHQIETTVDFCPRNPVLTWMLGGLNYQIEHHLFPRLPTRSTRRSRDRAAPRRAPRRALHVSAVARARAALALRATCARWAGAACRPRSRWADRYTTRDGVAPG